MENNTISSVMLHSYFDKNINKGVLQAEVDIERCIRLSAQNDGTHCILLVKIHKNDSSEMFLYKRAYEVADKISNRLSTTDYKFTVRVLRRGLFNKYLEIKVEIDWEHILKPARVI